MESILLKAIKDANGNYVGIGELTPDEIAVLTGNLKFADGTEQSTAYVAGSEAVKSVFGRTGAIVAVANDYTGAQVSFNPAASGLTSTNVQGAIDEITQVVKETANDMLFEGLLGFNDPDPTPPAQPGPTHYYIFNTAGNRTVGDATGAKIMVGDWLVYSRATSKWVHLDYSARTADAAGTVYSPGTNVYLTDANVQGALDQTDAELGAINARVDNLVAAGAGVTTFNTRTGDVMPAKGDYTGAQTTFAPTATLLSTDVQAAIEELDAKVASGAAVDDHVNNPDGAHTASAIAFVPVAKAIAATDVQAAIEEIAARSLPFFDTNGVSKPIPMA